MRKSVLLLLAVIAALLVLYSCESEPEESSLVVQARQAYAAGHFSDAEALYEEYLQTVPEGEDRWEAWNRLLDLALNVRGDYETADALLEAMYLEFGEDPDMAWDLMSRLATIYESLGDTAKAVETWQKALRIEDLDASHLGDVFLHLAKLFQEQRDYDLALEALEACGESAEDDGIRFQCRYETAQTLGYMQNWHRAKQELDELLETEGLTDDIRALAVFMLADIFEHEGDYSEAQALLESIRETYPNPRVVETRIEHLKEMRGQ